ncbi:MAG TPA: BatA and WFA domain-containing protein, partial [Planctomycetota bacterium]|nr:BatA and WFA domain-containing protein [Planctomycetota bacterium]
MKFLDPSALLWLGLAAPIVALYFLKMRRRKVEVPSTWLWRRGVNDLRVNAPFQRLRRSLLLLLQLLLLACGAFALARPSGAAAPPTNKRRVILVDRSASMQATDVAPSRLAKAKALAHEIVGESGPGDEIMVVAFAAYAQVMTPLTADRRAVAGAVDRITPSDGVTRIQEAYRLAASALEGAPDREIVVVSDGGVEAIEGAEDIPVRFIPVGAAARNAAVTALDVKPPATADGAWTVFAQVDLFHDRELELPVELHVNGQLKAVKAVKVPANASMGVLFEVERPAPETVMVKIDGADHLSVDDRAWHVVRGDRAKLLLAGPGNFFLEKALAQVRDADAFRMADLSKASLGEYAVVVIDGHPPPALPEGRYLIFGGVPAWEGIVTGPAVEQPAVVDWNRRHPVARHLDLSELAIKAAPKVT